MVFSSNRFVWFCLLLAAMSPSILTGQEFDFARSFLLRSSDCVVNKEPSEEDGKLKSAAGFSLSTDFGPDFEGRYAKSLCSRQAGSAGVKVLHSQLLSCQTKQSFFLQCRNYFLCDADRYAPPPDMHCYSMSNGVDRSAFELTQAVAKDKGVNWLLASLIFKSLYFHRELIPEQNEDDLVNLLSKFDLADDRKRRSLLVLLGIVLQRPETLTKSEVQRLIAYTRSSHSSTTRYEEPRGVELISNFELQRAILSLYQKTISEDWATKQ